MPGFHDLSTAQIREVLQLRERIESLQQRLDSLIGGEGQIRAKGGVRGPRAAKRRKAMSPQARAKIAEAARRRWAARKKTG